MIGSAGIIDHAASVRRTPPGSRLPRAHEAFETQADARPDDAALVYGDRIVSYGQLIRRAEAVADALNELGMTSGEFVAVFLDRSPDLVAAMLAVLKADGTFLPLDIEHPASRLEFLMNDSQPEWCITRETLLDRLPPSCQTVAWRDASGLVIAGRETSRRLPRQATDAARSPLAYAIYTSGSTGEPKAALLTHDGLAHLIASERRLLQLAPGRRVLQFASPAFDAAVWEIFGALASGATLVLGDREDLLPGERLRRTIKRLGVDTITLPPSVLAMLGSPDLPTLRTLVVAGEACSAALASQWSVGRRLINAYGPTEATVCATAYLCPQGEQSAPPLGQPLPHVELLVLDSDLRPVVADEPGELCLAGCALAQGYLNRPELTAEKFVRHPPVRYHDGRLYRTGDLVRRRPDGQLEFLGRIDRQVKIRGVRIEPGEITSVLELHPAVQAAATIAVNEGSGMRLDAFAIPRADSRLSPADLRAWLYARLPAAMTPSSLKLVDRWPLSPNGKLDERALLSFAAAKPSEEHSQVGQSANCSRVKLEGSHRLVADLVGRLLRVPCLSENDDFFELGGDSLKATELLVCIEKQFGRRLSLSQLLAHPTVERLAGMLDEMQPTKPSTIVPLTGDSRVADFVRSPADAAGYGQNSHEFCRARSSLSPWFFVHPAGGSAACYRNLARLMGRGRPCYGVESPVLAGDEPPLATIEAMADRYLDEMLEVQPAGPYLLAGWSLGGLLAYEMAHRLRAAGHAVPALVLIDSGVLYSFELLRQFVPTDDVPAFLWKTADRERMYARLRRHEGRRLLPDVPDERLARRMFETFWANVEAAYHYSPPDDDGPLTLVVGADAQGKRHPYREWHRRCQAIDVHELPARHLALLEPPWVDRVASILRSLAVEVELLESMV